MLIRWNWVVPPKTVAPDLVPKSEKVVIRIAAPLKYRKYFVQHDDNPSSIISTLASKAAVPVAPLTGGRWTQQDASHTHKESQLVGFLRLQKTHAEAVAKVSGQGGIFVHLQNPEKDKPSFFWIKKDENENEENYCRRCLALSKERDQPCVLRNGGGNDIGFLKKPDDTVETLVKTVDAMGFSARWDEEDIQTLFEALGWKQIKILSKKRIYGSFSWRLRGQPPADSKDQAAWTYAIPQTQFDSKQGDWTLNVLMAPPRVKPAETRHVPAPRRIFGSDSLPEPSGLITDSESGLNGARGRKGKSKGKGKCTDRPRSRTPPQERNRSTKESESDQAAPTIMDVSTQEQHASAGPPATVQPSDPFIPTTAEDLGTLGWTTSDQKGNGDCFFRACADCHHWMTAGKSITETKAQTEGAWFRSQACQHILKHRETFVNFFASQTLSQTSSFDTWIEKAALASTWVDGLLIHSLACKLGTAIVIWKASEDKGKGSWQRYCFAPKFHSGKARTAEKSQPLTVVLRNGHYVSLRSPIDNRSIPETWLRETVGHFRAKLGGAGKSVSGSSHSCRTPSTSSRISKEKNLRTPTVHSGHTGRVSLRTPSVPTQASGSKKVRTSEVVVPSKFSLVTPSVHSLHSCQSRGTNRFRIQGKQRCPTVHNKDINLDLEDHCAMTEPITYVEESEPGSLRPPGMGPLKDQRPSRQNRISTIQWVCPVCEVEMTLTGHDKALNARKRHLLTAHNKEITEVGPSIRERIRQGHRNRPFNKLRITCTQRAQIRLKQFEGEHDHNILHSGNSGLFPVFQRTWFCSKCLARGTSREMTQKSCSQENWNNRTANWWENVPETYRQKIKGVCNWSDSHYQAIQDIFKGIIENSEPANPKNAESSRKTSIRTQEKYKELRKAWRKRQGLPEQASRSGGLCAAAASVPKELPGVKIQKQLIKPNKHKNLIIERLSAAQQLQGPGQWRRNLTEDGDVEHNPGPSNHKKNRRSLNFSNLVIWQLNIDSWQRRGWQLLPEAEKAEVGIICLQEMKLTSLEATSLAKTLKKWQLFYQPEATQPDQRGPEGGVGILVQDDIPSIRAKAHSDEAGQWIRVSCPGFHIYSAYRRPGLNQQMYHGFDKALTEDMVALGRSPSLCLGDFNHDPLTMHAFQSLPNSNIQCVLENSGTDSEPCWTPEPTRWEGNRCIDWGVAHDIDTSVSFSNDKWSDHRLLCWNLPKVGIQRSRKLRFSPRLNMKKPDNVSEAEWEEALAKEWTQVRHTLSQHPNWDELCHVTETICRRALSYLEPDRKLRHGSSKAKEAETENMTRHHNTHVEGELNIRCKRLRRLWRRAFAWHKGDINQNLKQNLCRELRWFNADLSLLDHGQSQNLLNCITDLIEHELDVLKQQRISQWKAKIRQQQQYGWKLLARHKALTTPVHFLS